MIISIYICFQKQPSPSEVVQWSNHRVMEWLRAVDLAEFAPNLRGSGVHGGLVVSTINETDHNVIYSCYNFRMASLNTFIMKSLTKKNRANIVIFFLTQYF